MAGSRLTDRRLPLAAICLFVACARALECGALPDRQPAMTPPTTWRTRRPLPRAPAPHPSKTTATEYYTPPGFYFLAGSVDWVCEGARLRGSRSRRTGAEHRLPARDGPARRGDRPRLWPGRRRIELGAAAFVAFLPVVVETDGDVPSGAAVAAPLDARALALRPHVLDPRYAWALGVTLGARQLVRACRSSTVAAVFARAARRPALPGARRSSSSSRSLIPAPWYIHQRMNYGGQPQFTQPAQARRPLARVLLRPGIPGIVTQPSARSITTRWIPTTYDGLWGDYFGVWALARGRRPRMQS